MSTVDTRIVEMRINNTQFLSGVKETLSALTALEKATRFQGAAKGFSDLNSAANKVSLINIANQADKVNNKLGSIDTRGVTNVSAAAGRVDMSHIGNQADQASNKISSISSKGLTDLTGAADRVDLSRISKQADQASSSINNISTKGLADLTGAADRVDLSHIGKQADQVSGRISAMAAAGAVALGNLVSKATSAGLNLAKSLTISPMMDGLKEYETGLNSVQTIMANTQAAGTTLPQVNAALKDLNNYADQTIYNFSEMTRNVGTFTAAGVDLGTAQQSIKGIANLAALSGSNSQQASTAMYQLSQAISSGKVSLMDWNSVVNAGMGGSVFQRALAQTAVKMGTLDKGAVSLQGKMKNVKIEGQSFRDSISAEKGPSWLTSDVLTGTLKQLAGGFTDAELKAQGFNDAEIKAIQSQAKMATDAATKVKTFSQLIDTTKEAVGSGWADTWQIVFGDFEGAKKLWTGVSKVVNDMVSNSAKARNKMLGDWAKAGGRTDLFEGLKNTFNGLKSVMKPIQEGFREIFPKTTGKQLAEISKSFRELTSHFKLGAETANNLKRTFAGVFAVFGIGWEVIKGVGRIFAELFKSLGGGTGGILRFTGSIGDLLVALHGAIKNGEGFKQFFTTVGKVIAAPIKIVGAFIKAISGIFKVQPNMTFLDKFKGAGSIFESVGKTIDHVVDTITASFSKIGDALGPVGDMISGLFKTLSDSMQGSTTKDLGETAKVILGVATAFHALGTIKKVKDFMSSMNDITEGLAGALDNLTSPFQATTDTLNQMQKTLKAVTLVTIAAAIGILVASLVALSRIPADDLKKALAAMGGAFIELAAAMAVFQFINIGKGMGQLVLVAAAIRVLTSALVEMSKLKWDELAKGLVGTGVLLAGVVLAAKAMPDGKKMISSSLGLIAMAAAIRILVSAVEDLAKLKWDELAKGLLGVGGILAALTLFTKFADADKMGLSKGLGILLLAAAMKVLASAVSDFAKMDWEDIAKGLVGIGGGLTIIAGAMRLMPPSTLLSAASILVVAASLKLIADAMVKMGDMKWDEIAKGLTAMAGSLVSIGLALKLFPPTSILSAAAILVVASSLGLIADALKKMGNMKWDQVAKGLISLAGSLVAIAGALRLMPPSTLLSAASILLVATSLGKIGDALKNMSTLSIGDTAQSLVALAGSLGAIALGLSLMPPSTLLSAAAIIMVASSLGMITDAVLKMSTMSIGDTAQSLVALAGALTAIALALTLMPPSTLLSAASILLVASSLGMISNALLQMATMSWNDIAQGLVALAGALTIISLAVNSMVASLPGAAALVVVVGALWLLVPLMMQLGAMAWEDIGKGLLAMAGALTILGAAGVLITAAVPGLIGLGTALAAIGIAVLAAGAGVAAFGIGLQMIADSGMAALPVVQGLLNILINNLPPLATALGQTITNFLVTIKTNAPLIVSTFVAILSSMLAGVRTLAPQVGQTFTTILQTILAVIRANAPTIITTFVSVASKFLEGVRKLTPQIMATFTTLLQGILGVVRANTPAIMATFTTLLQGLLATIRANTPSIVNTFLFMLQQLLSAAQRAVPMIVNAGANIIIGFLNGMAQKIPGIVTAATNLIVNFLNAIGNNLPRIAQAGADLVIKFINSVADTIRKNSKAMGDAGGNLATAIIEGMVKGLGAGAGKVWDAAKNVAKGALDKAKSWLGINSPSKEFMKVGAWSSEGMAIGIDKQAKMVGVSAIGMANTALDATRKALDINSPSKKFQELGKYSADGYIKGLKSGGDKIKSVTDEMRKKLNAAMADEKKQIASLSSKLVVLGRHRRRNRTAIARTAYELIQLRSEYAKTTRAMSVLNSFNDENARLKSLSDRIASTTQRITDANKALEEATKKRDDYKKSVQDQFSNLPEISKDTKWANYISDLQKRVVDTKIFNAQLVKLKKLGLNDEMYKDLVSKGIDAIPFVTQLLQKGKNGVNEINALDSALMKASSTLAYNSSKALYQAGVDSAAGLLKGLQSQKSNLQKEMDNLANSMVKQLKRALGIKSPSREFMAVGDWAIQGLVVGLSSAQPVEVAARKIGNNAAEALRSSLGQTSTYLQDTLKTDPVIRPVLDLSSIESQASKIPGIMGSKPISLDGTIAQARFTSAQLRSAPMDEKNITPGSGEVQPITFIQNNNSPKALSEAEIYRNTRNQLSRVKGVLTSP